MNAEPRRAADLDNTPVLLRRDLAGGIAVLTLNRPEAYNSLSTELMRTMLQTLDEIREDKAARVVVLEGAGRGFSAGHDLKEMRGLTTADARRQLFALCAEMMMAVVHFPKPVIAKVHGVATAAGCQLVASCDLAYAASDARFATPGVNIGLFCHTPMVALSRNVARKHAMEMLLVGEPVDAETAVQIGLINRHVPPAEVEALVLEQAAKIASKSLLSMKLGKEAFYRQLEMGQAEAYAYAADVFVENLAAKDAKEGIDAFIEKRQPRWRDA